MSKFNFDKVVGNLKQVQGTLPSLLANQAQNFFMASFKNQGWDGQGWKEVLRRTPGTPEYKYPSKPKASARTNPILVRSGVLRRAVGNSIRSKTFNSIRLVVDLPYAQRHNEGLDGMPARPFMKDSATLRALQQQMIEKNVDKIWNT